MSNTVSILLFIAIVTGVVTALWVAISASKKSAARAPNGADGKVSPGRDNPGRND